jgi:hypothetical protein
VKFDKGAAEIIFGLMGNTLAGGVYVVEATKGDQTEYWAAATPRADAVIAVLERLPPGWQAILTVGRLTIEEVGSLNLRPNGVRQLKSISHDQASQNAPQGIQPSG